MAIAFDSASNSGYQASISNFQFDITITGTDRCIALSVTTFVPETPIGNPDGPAYTCNGVPLALYASSTRPGLRAEVWVLVAPATGTVTIDCQVAETNAANIVSACSLTGVDQVFPVALAEVANGTTNPASVVLDVGESAEYWAVDALSVGVSESGLLVGAGQTERSNVGGSLGSGGQSTETGDDPTEMSWALDGDWAIAAVALRPAVSQQTATPLTREITVTAIPSVRSATGAVNRTPGTTTVTVSGTSPAVSATGVAVVYPWTEFPASVTVSAVSPVAYGTGVAVAYPWTEFPANVTVSGVAPACSATGSVSRTPATVTVTISAIAAAGAPSGFVYRAPDVASAAVSAVAPVATGTGSATATPAVATITASATSPTAYPTGDLEGTPGAASVIVSAVAPTATAQGVVSRAPGFAIVTASGVSPDESGLGIATASPGVATVTITATDPTAYSIGSLIGTPGTAAVTVSAVDATVTPGTLTRSLRVATVTIGAVVPLTEGWILLDCPCCPEDDGSGSGSGGGGTVAVPCCMDNLLPATLYVTFRDGTGSAVTYPVEWDAASQTWFNAVPFPDPFFPGFCLQTSIYCPDLGSGWLGGHSTYGGVDCGTIIGTTAVVSGVSHSCDPLSLEYDAASGEHWIVTE